MATDSDRAYEEWLRLQLTQLQSQQQTSVSCRDSHTNLIGLVP